MKFLLRHTAIAGLAGLMLAAGAARAEKADQDKPVNIEADRVSVDDAKRIQTFEGNVQLKKGTLVIRAARIVVTQDDNGYQRGVATGGANGLASFRQKREGLDEYIDGEAERIEHDAKTEKTDLHVRAYVKSGADEVRGQFITYDGKTENYLVTSGRDGTSALAAGKPDRVRAVIQPKKDGKPIAPAGPGVSLKIEPEIANPRPE